MSVSKSSYSEFFSQNPGNEELLRLQALERLCDDTTKQHLWSANIADAHRVLEVGPGAGSILRWMAETVDASASVIGVDIDPQFMTDLPANAKFLELSVVDGDFGSDYDIIHTRNVLAHIPERDVVLTRLVEALSPGGALVVEEPLYGYWSPAADMSRVEPDRDILAEHINETVNFFEFFGIDMKTYGIRVPVAMREAGLVNVRSELRAPLLGGPANAGNEFALRVRNLFDMGVESGALNKPGVDRAFEIIDDPEHYEFALAFVSSTGYAAPAN